MPYPFPNHRPICPIDQLPEPLRSAAQHVITTKGVPAAAALTDALAATGAVVHCGFDCQTAEGDLLPATINTCALAPTAVGKGRSYQVFFKSFIQAKKTHSRQDRTTQGTQNAPPKGRSPRVEAMVTNAISMRALMEILDGDSMNMTLQREDGASLLDTDLFKKHTSALTQLWSGDPPLDWQVRGVSLEANDARGSVGFRIQPDLMYDHVARHGRKDRGVGWWSRSVVGCYDPERFPENESYQAPSGHHSADRYHVRTQALIAQINQKYEQGAFSRVPVELDVNASAYMRALSHYIKKWEKSEYHDIQDAARRAWENTLRISVVLQVFCGQGTEVRLEMVKSAWAIMEWSLAQYRWVFVEAPLRYSDKALLKPRTSTPRASNNWVARTPKPAKRPRPMENADWLLLCLDRAIASVGFRRAAHVSEVRLLADIPEKSFQAALEWLKIDGRVEVFQDGAEKYICRTYARTTHRYL